MLNCFAHIFYAFYQVNYLAAELLAGEGLNYSTDGQPQSSFVSAAPSSSSSSSSSSALGPNIIDAMSQLEEQNLATSTAVLTRKRVITSESDNESDVDSNEFANARKKSDIAVNVEEIDI